MPISNASKMIDILKNLTGACYIVYIIMTLVRFSFDIEHLMQILQYIQHGRQGSHTENCVDHSRITHSLLLLFSSHRIMKILFCPN